MTSKEALENLKESSCLSCSEDNCKECFITRSKRALEKDLEVLEILKQKTILYEDNTQGSGYINSNGDFHCEVYTYYFLNGIETDKETYFKLKEWLENDK